MKIKKLAGVFLSAAVILANFSFCFAEENKGSSIELAVTGTAYSDENIVGGNIYYDPETGTITGCDDSVTSAVIPSEINGVKVTSIGYAAFYDCGSLTSITIPEGVTSIGDYVFIHCHSLTSITIPEGVTSIGDGAFESCGLTSITIPEGVTSIGNDAFYNCGSLTSINVGDDNEQYSDIEGILFNKDKTIILGYPGGVENSTYVIPKSVTSIGNGAFSSCSKLTSVTIPEGVTSIGDRAFSSCIKLTSITIPEGVTSIGDGAFSNCSELTSVTIPEGVTSIGDGAFEKCKSLTSITIPEGVTSIGDRAFSSCIKLTSITIPDSVTSIEDAAFGDCGKLIVYCYEGSYAKAYAEEKNIPFEIIKEETKIIFDSEIAQVEKDKTVKLNVTVSPENERLIWESSNSNVAMVDQNGVVRGIAEGFSVITVSAADNSAEAKCFVIVSGGSVYPTGVLGDVDGDGVVTAADAALVLRKALNGEFRFPIE